MKRVALITFILLAILTCTVQAEENYELVQNQSTMKILGTSSMHDWHMSATMLDCKGRFTSLKENSIQILGSLFILKVQNIKSGNSVMDGIAYDALKAKTYPEINFTLESIKKSSDNSNGFKGIITGYLSVAGVKKTISFPIDAQITSDGLVKLSGKAPLKMTDFGIKPPKAMLGMLKTGDDIKIDFDLTFKKQ